MNNNIYTEYVADMTILLGYYKCIDDWKDEKKATVSLIMVMIFLVEVICALSFVFRICSVISAAEEEASSVAVYINIKTDKEVGK